MSKQVAVMNNKGDRFVGTVIHEDDKIVGVSCSGESAAIVFVKADGTSIPPGFTYTDHPDAVSVARMKELDKAKREEQRREQERLNNAELDRRVVLLRDFLRSQELSIFVHGDEAVRVGYKNAEKEIYW